MAHITGGGIAENLVRILPEGVRAVIQKSAIPLPDIFKTIQRLGQVDKEEMYRVFNMGVGMIVISGTPLPERPDFFPIGKIEAGEKSVVLS